MILLVVRLELLDDVFERVFTVLFLDIDVEPANFLDAADPLNVEKQSVVQVLHDVFIHAQVNCCVVLRLVIEFVLLKMRFAVVARQLLLIVVGVEIGIVLLMFCNCSHLICAVKYDMIL